jgi:hypothetical protein
VSWFLGVFVDYAVYSFQDLVGCVDTSLMGSHGSEHYESVAVAVARSVLRGQVPEGSSRTLRGSRPSARSAEK